MSMTLPLVEQLAGQQRPRVFCAPAHVASAGDEAIELARMAGLHLDPWQEFVLGTALNERADGRWAAFEVGLDVSRQNGKGSILEARELAGLFLLDERLIVHSAHQFDTSLEAFRRLLELIESTPDFDRRVHRVSKSHGEEGVELRKNARTGLRQRIRFRTRTKGGGRGFSSDCLMLDEAMILPESTVGALMPTLSARPNPQVWYVGSAVDQELHQDGVAFARVRARGHRGDDPSLAYFEWSLPAQTPDEVTPEMAQDPEMWAQANPGLGIRISHDYIRNEQRSLDPRTFAVERLGVGDWPPLDGKGPRVIPEETWLAAGDRRTTIDNGVAFAIDATPDHTHGSIAAAGHRKDGLGHFEVIEHRRRTDWIIDRSGELQREYPGAEFAVDSRGPAAALITELQDAGVNVREVTTQEYGRACGAFVIAVTDATARYPEPQPELDAALTGATKRTIGDSWAWSRRNSSVDISPLVAATLALWLAEAARESPYESKELLILE